MTQVLVVDDEPQIRRALRTSLGAHGYEVRTAANGEEAVVAAAEETLDLVFLDLGLPDLDGTEVIRRSGHSRTCRSSCCRSATGKPTRSMRSMRAPTTM